VTRLSSCKANITIRSDVDVVLSEEATKEVVTQASGDAPTDAVAKLFASQAGVGGGAEGIEEAEMWLERELLMERMRWNLARFGCQVQL